MGHRRIGHMSTGDSGEGTGGGSRRRGSGIGGSNSNNTVNGGGPVSPGSPPALSSASLGVSSSPLPMPPPSPAPALAPARSPSDSALAPTYDYTGWMLKSAPRALDCDKADTVQRRLGKLVRVFSSFKVLRAVGGLEPLVLSGSVQSGDAVA